MPPDGEGTQTGTLNLGSLPNEIQAKILSRCPTTDIVAAGRVSQSFRKASKESISIVEEKLSVVRKTGNGKAFNLEFPIRLFPFHCLLAFGDILLCSDQHGNLIVFDLLRKCPLPILTNTATVDGDKFQLSPNRNFLAVANQQRCRLYRIVIEGSGSDRKARLTSLFCLQYSSEGVGDLGERPQNSTFIGFSQNDTKFWMSNFTSPTLNGNQKHRFEYWETDLGSYHVVSQHWEEVIISEDELHTFYHDENCFPHAYKASLNGAVLFQDGTLSGPLLLYVPGSQNGIKAIPEENAGFKNILTPSPCGKYIVYSVTRESTTGTYERLMFWDWKSQSLVWTSMLPFRNEQCFRVVRSQDGRIIVVFFFCMRTGYSLTSWTVFCTDSRQKSCVQLEDPDNLHSLAIVPFLSNDGEVIALGRVYSGSESRNPRILKSVVLYMVATGKKLDEVEVDRDAALQVWDSFGKLRGTAVSVTRHGEGFALLTIGWSEDSTFAQFDILDKK